MQAGQLKSQLFPQILKLISDLFPSVIGNAAESLD